MLRKYTSQLVSCNFRRHLPGFVFCCLALLVAACGGGGADGTTADDDFFVLPDPDSPLIGSWVGSGCEISAEASRNNSYLFNSDGTVQLTFRNYATTNCSSLASTDTAFARFIEGQERMLDDGRFIRELDFERLSGRVITPTSSETTQSFNMTAACGITDWQLNVPREVQTCQTGLFEADAQLLDVAQIYNITDDYFLYFGNELIFSTEQRPTQLTPTPSHVRQLQEEEGFPSEVLGFWQISETDFYYELRTNAILVEYLPSETRPDCFDVAVAATRALGNNAYGAPGTQPILIVPTMSGISFVTPAGETFLEPAAPVLPTDLVPCASLPGG